MPRSAKRKSAFVIVASDHGTMIVNRLDYKMVDQNKGFGVGFDILEGSSYVPGEVDLAMSLLELRRKYSGDGVIAIDCGANIGAHTIEWAKKMTGWGRVIAFEAQERVFYALAGNIAINNCFNAKAVLAAVSAENGTMRIPNPDYLKPSSFGSLELKKRDDTEFIGQNIDYSDKNTSEIQSLSLDSQNLERIDLIKIDVEGMEFEVLTGAKNSILRTKPVLIVEWIKSGKDRLRTFVEDIGYTIFESGVNLLAVHTSDPALAHIKKS